MSKKKSETENSSVNCQQLRLILCHISTLNKFFLSVRLLVRTRIGMHFNVQRWISSIVRLVCELSRAYTDTKQSSYVAPNTSKNKRLDHYSKATPALHKGKSAIFHHLFSLKSKFLCKFLTFFGFFFELGTTNCGRVCDLFCCFAGLVLPTLDNDFVALYTSNADNWLIFPECCTFYTPFKCTDTNNKTKYSKRKENIYSQCIFAFFLRFTCLLLHRSWQKTHVKCWVRIIVAVSTVSDKSDKPPDGILGCNNFFLQIEIYLCCKSRKKTEW